MPASPREASAACSASRWRGQCPARPRRAWEGNVSPSPAEGAGPRGRDQDAAEGRRGPSGLDRGSHGPPPLGQTLAVPTAVVARQGAVVPLGVPASAGGAGSTQTQSGTPLCLRVSPTDANGGRAARASQSTRD